MNKRQNEHRKWRKLNKNRLCTHDNFHVKAYFVYNKKTK